MTLRHAALVLTAVLATQLPAACGSTGAITADATGSGGAVAAGAGGSGGAAPEDAGKQPPPDPTNAVDASANHLPDAG